MKLGFCVACGTNDNLHHHHLLPRVLGGEDDNNNLITLCGGCHAKIHRTQGVWRHSELIKVGLAKAKAQGKKYAASRFGYDIKGDNFVPNEDEQKCIARIKEIMGGGKDYAGTARKLCDEGYTRKNGKPWCRRSLRNFCLRHLH